MSNIKNKKISPIVGRLIPDYIKEESPGLEVFVKGFFKYLEKDGNPYDIMAHLLQYGNIDETSDEYIKYFKSQWASALPDRVDVDFRFLIKKIREFYRAKGSEDAIKFLLRFLFDEESEIIYPRENILKCSDGVWQVPTYIRPKSPVLLGDLNFYQDTLVEGETSGARVYIETVEYKEDPSNPLVFIPHLKVLENSFQGVFQNDEVLAIVDADKDFSSYNKISTDTQSAGTDAITKDTGRYLDRSGFLSDEDVLQDSHYWQDFSYVIVSEVSLNFYKDKLKELVHPAGYQVFGRVKSSDDAIDAETLDTAEFKTILASENSTPNQILVSIDELINLTSSILEVDVMNSFGYYEKNKEDPIVRYFFRPCLVEDLSSAAFEVFPNAPMEYFSTEGIRRNYWGEINSFSAAELNPTQQNGIFGQYLSVTKNSNRIVVADISSLPGTGFGGFKVYTLDSKMTPTIEQEFYNVVPNTSFYAEYVDIDYTGDRLIASFNKDSRILPDAGSVEVWSRSGTTWSLEQTLTSPVPASNTFFGYLTFINDTGDKIFVDESAAANGGINRGEVHVFERYQPTAWQYLATIAPDIPSDNERFGTLLAISQTGRYVVSLGYLSLYIFDNGGTGSVWTQTEYFDYNFIPNLNGKFDMDFSKDGSTIVVTNGTSNIDVLHNDGLSWNLRTVNSTISEAGSVAISFDGNQIFVGEKTDTGRYHILEWNGTEYIHKRNNTLINYGSPDLVSFGQSKATFTGDAAHVFAADRFMTVENTFDGSVFTIQSEIITSIDECSFTFDSITAPTPEVVVSEGILFTDPNL